LRRPAAADLRRRLVGAALTVAVVAGCGAAPARAGSAPEDFLSQLKTIAEIRFRGRSQLPANELKRALRTRSPSIWPWADEVPLRLDFLSADTLALRAAYREHGFLDARVESVTVTPARNRAKPQVIVTYYLTEGRRSYIRSVDFSSNDHYPTDALRKKLLGRPGRPFNPGYLSADTARISAAYQDRGYKPAVSGEAVRDARDPLQIHVHYQIVEGPLYHFGQVYLS